MIILGGNFWGKLESHTTVSTALTTARTFPFPFTEKLQRAKASKKESCPFCQEHKKRPLIAYMRKRAQEKNDKICEEVQEEDEMEEAEQTHCKNGHMKELRK